MRQNNSCNIFLQQATYLISLNNYDKRALTVTDTGPLTHSLLNLAYLSASSPQKISNLLSSDGGLLILIKRLNRSREKLVFSAILSILTNLVIRGNSGFRLLCFNLNILNPLYKLLKESLSLLNSQSSSIGGNEENSAFERVGDSLGIVPMTGPINIVDENIVDQNIIEQGNNRENIFTEMIRKFDDVVLALKILCYLSKYQEIRYKLHNYEQGNVFGVIEPFTLLSDSFTELRKWSIIAMRNAFKRDPNKSGLRKCGNLNCPKWELSYHEFSKCSRCRRVVYCSKSCQKISWPLHRNWCLVDNSRFEKTAVSHQNSTSSDLNALALERHHHENIQ